MSPAKTSALVPTELGQLVTDMMTENFKSIVDVQFTADMEEDLDAIEEEGKDWHKVVKKFYDAFCRAAGSGGEEHRKGRGQG